MDADDALWCFQIFRVIVGYMSPFDDGNLSDLMRLALVSKRVRTLVVRFLADPHTSTRAVFSDPLKFNRTMTDRPLGLLIPPGPLSMLGSRGSHRVTRSGCIGNVAAPSDWSLVRVGSVALLPSSDEDINKRLALLARIVPDLHEVHAMMPESRNGGLQLTFPDNVKRASITCLGNVNVSSLTNVSGSSVIGGPGIEELMILVPSMILASVGCLAIPNARSLLMSCDVRSFDGIGRLSSLVALFTRVRDCEPRALTCIGELHGLRDLGLSIPSRFPVTNGALVSLTGLCSLEVHSTVATARALVQVAGLSLEHVTKLCILRDECDESSVHSDTESPISEPLGFLRSARSMARLSLQWCVCVCGSFLFDHLN